ncbi:uncharacterized protein LOC100678779 [Nasonia vitripennis]|uniref:Translation initiation factor IF-3 n=1 Tax=Nasonia vitripennis TaxID=7425 RepID=A0A7M7QC78_NASVI|nr:uncharacterized protein LOC100678779 [Nasonia vitripennis]
MAFAGVCRTSQVLRTFRFSKSRINYLTEIDNKNVNLTLSCNIVCNKFLCTEEKFKPVNKSNNPNAPEKPKKRKPLTSPQVTLISPEDDISMMTLEQAKKLADRRKLKLVKILDFDTKSQKPLFKLMTSQEFFEEGVKFKERKKKEKDAAVKEDKLFTISTKTTEHDLYIKINQIMKLLKKKHEIRIFISKDGNHTKAQELVELIEKEIKELISTKTCVSKATAFKLSFMPKLETDDKNNNVNNENQQKDTLEEEKTKASGNEK